MNKSYKRRPNDFKRRIIKTNITERPQMYVEEQRYLDMIKRDETKPINNKPRYYNLALKNGDLWHKYPEKIKTIGQKISLGKTGKNTGPRDPSVGRKISEVKKGKPFTEAHIQALKDVKREKYSDERKEIQRKVVQKQWDTGKRARKRVEPKVKLTKEERAQRVREGIAKRWADPVWAAKQRQRLSEGSKTRPPRSDESKRKASIAQLGIAKPRKNILL